MFNLTYILVVALHKIKTWLFVNDIYKNKAAKDKRKRTNRFCQLVLFVWMQQQPFARLRRARRIAPTFVPGSTK